MKDNFRIILADNIVRIATFSSIFFILIQTILVLIFISRFPPLIPLLNSRPWGSERLFAPQAILAIPLIFLIIFVVHTILSVSFYGRNILISRILSFNALLFILLGFLAFIQIVFLVF